MVKKLSAYDAILNASENTVIPILENGVNKKISADNLLKKNIIDSLGSTEVAKPLSAAKGKTLKDALDALTTTVGNKQDTLVSGTNIKTVNNVSILGAGNIVIEASGSGLGGTNYVFVRGNGIPTENAGELQEAYNTAKTMSPSSGNIVTVVVAPGKYTFGGTAFAVDAPHINIVSLTGNADVLLDGINVTANNVYLKGLNCGDYSFQIGDNLNNLKCENCISHEEFSFGGTEMEVSGVFNNCTGGSYSFGGEGTASGTFTNCVGGNGSFGGEGGTVSGTFSNCIGGNGSFGGAGIIESIARLYYCRLTSGTFETPASGGKLVLCIDGNNAIVTTA